MKNKVKLTTQFDKYLKISKELLVQIFNELEIEEVFNQMRNEFENLIPEIPFVGGRKNSFTFILVECVSMLPFYSVLENNGMTYREISDYNYQFWEKYTR
ncbi:MAG: hypothetical protein ACFFG0_29720 [Candidatus Thorarchaeota archaeon]